MYIQKIINNNQIDIAKLFINKSHNSISYDTYFNSLNYGAINKYLSGRECLISFNYKGEATFNIIVENKCRKKILYSKKISSPFLNKFISINIDLSSLWKGGIIYPSFTNIKSGFIAKDIEYRVETKESKVEIIAIISTYKRENYVMRNIEKLKGCKSFIKHVLIIDNGGTLFKKINSNDFITIINNKNLGGSGAFARGMLEAKKISCTHILLMDDDINFIDETFNRSFNFIKSLNDYHKKDWIGYAMLNDDRPTIQYEMGCNWNGFKMWINNHNINLVKKGSLFRNIKHQKYNYSAWWSLIMPISVVNDYNFPSPFFIKFDDIEYALRRKDEEIIFDNGLGIWHESFSKKYSHVIEYYLMRNALITNSIKFKMPLFVNLIRYIGKYIKSIFQFNIKSLLMINKGVDDYIKGPLYLNETINSEYKESLIKSLTCIKHSFLLFLKFIYLLPIYILKIIILSQKTKSEFVKYSKIFKTEQYWDEFFK